MRIVAWNINGLRTLRGYQPWYQMPDWQACLSHLQADIACFQETKITRKQLQEWMCILPDYHAFFDLHPTKGYSGTVTYVNKHLCNPLKAEQGITGRLSDASNQKEAIGSYPTDSRDELDPSLFHSLDAEGRAVVVDCGLFVLFNLYAPNETGPERLDYKMSYYRCLAERVHRLIDTGRQVMIVGDMNIIRDRIDHCDPEQSLRENQMSHFKQHPARTWFDEFLAPRGRFHDVGRIFHPTRQRMFTCWNTLIDARPANYGVRLDYTLVTEALLPWIKGADIQPDIYGSDHCPIYIDLHDSREIDGKTVLLKDLMHGGSTRAPPSLAACNYHEFSGKQRKLASFFTGARAAGNKPGVSPSVAELPKESQPVLSSETQSLPETSVEERARSDGTPSLAEALFALQAPAPSDEFGNDSEHLEADSKNVAGGAAMDEPSVSAPVPTTPSEPARRASETASIAVTAQSGSQTPSQSGPLLPKRKPTAPAKASPGKKAPSKAGKGQLKLQSFFGKPAAAAPRQNDDEIRTRTMSPDAPAEAERILSESLPTGASGDEGNQDGLVRARSSESIEQFEAGSTGVSQPSTVNLTSPSQTHARVLSSTSSSSQDATITSAPAEPEPSAADRVEASLAWGAIFSPLPPPTCRNHLEPAKAWKVNKPGPNHGRKFWLCARPVGPGYEKSGRAKGDVNPEFRCNFFLWDSEWRSEAARKRRKDEVPLGAVAKAGVGVGAGGEGGGMSSFVEVERMTRGKKGREVIGGDDGAPHKRIRPSR